MPSGAKKRKAAKKKKEKEADINPPSNNPQGSDDLKSQDGKGSDGGEGSSSAYHDHDDHPFNEGSEEVEEGDQSVAYPSISDIKPMEEVPGDITNAEVVGGQEFSVVKIESDLKSEERSDRVNENVENVRSFKESLDGHGNSSGTASDEFLKKDNSKDELYNSQQKAFTSEGLTYPVDSSTEVAGGHKVIVKIDSGLKSENNSERINDSVADVNYTSELVGEREVSAVKIVSDLEYEESSTRINERVDHIESTKESRYGNGNSSGTSNVESLSENNSKDEPNNSKQMAIISEALAYPVDDSSTTKISLTSENPTVKETSNLVVEPCVNSVKEGSSLSEVKSNDNGSASLEESVSQVAAVDLAMKKHEDKVFPLPDQNVTIPDMVESPPTDYGSKVSTSVSENPTPVPESTNDAGHAKGSETPECSENKPQVVSAPHMVQKACWLNCCGLFDVLSGSNR
ncbi:hypothetical protein QN277_005776 [Acacia crassicarpa]|uniref:Uncharacterized protein n=1 Tax=Acacia crassicarpa TaxID=499986 RepID=A0AAE1MA41_9FABA|nr:hypothetical protein QN277_005776 [Acacia crassicarpa]